jgi:hypothetical protein
MVQIPQESSATPEEERRDSLVLREAESNGRTIDQKVHQALGITSRRSIYFGCRTGRSKAAPTVHVRGVFHSNN